MDLAKDYEDVSDPEGEPCAVWERVSTTMTRQEIRAQTKALRDFIAGNGYRVAKVFRFDASAYKGEHSREQAQMLEDVAAGKYKVIISALTSRYERRGAKHALRLALDLDLHGARVIAIDDPNYGDMDSELGIVGTVLKAKSDHDYSASVSKTVNMHFGLMDEENAFRGAIPGGYAITGSKKSKQLVPHPYGAEIVVQAFLDCAEGKSTPAIARTFKAANDRYNATLPEGATRLRLPASHHAVSVLLRNPVYSTGRYVSVKRDGSGTYEYVGPALISPAQQRAAIKAMEDRGHDGKDIASRAIKKEDYSGAIFCADHGERGHRTFSNGKPRPDGSRPKYRRYVFRHCCGKSVDATRCDEAIEEFMGGNPMPWWVPVTNDPNAGRDRELGLVERELRDLASLDLDDAEEDKRRSELRAERDRLQSIPDQDVVTYGKVVTDPSGKPMSEGDKWRMLSPAERRDLLLTGRYRVLAQNAGDRSGRVVVRVVEPDDD